MIITLSEIVDEFSELTKVDNFIPSYHLKEFLKLFKVMFHNYFKDQFMQIFREGLRVKWLFPKISDQRRKKTWENFAYKILKEEK